MYDSRNVEVADVKSQIVIVNEYEVDFYVFYVA